MFKILRTLSVLSITFMAIDATAAPSAAVAHTAAPTYAVLLTGGHESQAIRSYAGAAIIKALRARGAEAVPVDDPAGDLSVLGPALCASTGADVLLGGSVALQIMPDREINQWAQAKIEVSAYDCAQHRRLESHSADGAAYNWTWAIDRAVDEAVKAIARE